MTQVPGTGVSRRPLVSVIVPVRDEEDHIVACLAALSAQSFTDLEIVVVDGASSDATVDLVKRFSVESKVAVRVVSNPGRTIPTALNRGAASARGSLLVRVDGHATVDSRYVARLVAHLESGRWAGVGGRKEAVGSSTVGAAFSIAFGSVLGAGNSRYHYGKRLSEVDHVPFGAYPKYVVSALGGWDESLLVNQDFEFDFRLRQRGGSLLLDPAIVIHWRARETLRAVAYQYFRYGRGKARVVRKQPRSIQARQIAAPLVAISAVCAVAGVITRRAPLVVPHAVYTATAVAGGLLTARRRDASLRIAGAVPFVLVAMHHSWGVGFLRGLLDGGNLVDPFRRNPTRRDVRTMTGDCPRGIA